MRVFRLLFKIQALSLFGINKLRYSKNKSEKTQAIVVLASFTCGFIAISMYSYLVSVSAAALGVSYILPGLMYSTVFIFSLFLTVFEVNSLLFSFRDYDQVMSLPVKPREVILSRLAVLYLLNLLFAISAMLPAAFVYCLFETPPISVYITQIFGILLAPCIPIALAAGIGAGIAFIAARLKRMNIIALILSLAPVAVFTLNMLRLGSSAGDGQSAGILEIARSIDEMITNIYPPALFYKNAVVDNSGVFLLIFAGVCVISVAVIAVLLGFFYTKLNALITAGAHRRKYKLTAQKAVSPMMALYKKELMRLFTCTVYASNACFGALMYLVVSAAALFYDIQGLFTGSAAGLIIIDYMQVLPFAAGLMVSVSSTTASSISLEGKNRWLMLSLPVRPVYIYASKLAVHLTVYIPVCIIGGVCLSAGFGFGLLQTVYMILIPAVFCVLSGTAGLFFNYYFPKFDWTSEFYAVKDSAAGLFTMLTGLMICGAFLTLNILLPGFSNIIKPAAILCVSSASFVLFKTISKKRLYM